MRITIDRFEEDFAVIECENGEHINAPKKLFDFAKEGDCIELSIVEEEENDSPHSLFEKLRKKSKK